MVQIVPAGSFNPASLTADDFYLTILNPPGYVSGVATDVFGIVGTASWGPVNQPQHMSNPHDALVAWGAIAAVALTDSHDLATDLAIAFGQAATGAVIEGWAVRVTDGTDTAASAALPGAATSAALVVTATGSAVAADTCSITLTQSALTGSPVTFSTTVVTGDTLATVMARLAGLINANASVVALGGVALTAGAVLSFYQPTSLSPQFTLSSTSGASITLTNTTGATSTAGLLLSGIYTGILGANITCQIQAGAATTTWTAILALPQIGAQEIYPNITGGQGFWQRLANAINNGLSNVRGPSQIAKATAVNIGVGAPTATTTSLTGGSDGRTGVTTANMLGSNTAYPVTGLWALNNLSPAVGVTWLAGVTDTTAWATVLSFGQTAGSTVLAAFATGTSTSTALTAIQTNGIHDPCFAYVKDWVYWFDAINNTTRLSPPYAFIGGTIATLPPQQNPGNQTCEMVIGTERYAPSGSQPYGLGEIGQLASAGVMFITNPIPAGSQWGIREGQSTSLSGATQGIEWWRTTVFLARSFAATLGQFVNKNQSQQPNDPLRNAIKNQSNTFLTQLVGGDVIDSFATICAFNANPSASPGNGVNTPASISQHYLYVMWRVTYLSTVRFLIGTLQGGTTVVTVGATPGQQLAA